jgi:hypothetical protein
MTTENVRKALVVGSPNRTYSGATAHTYGATAAYGVARPGFAAESGLAQAEEVLMDAMVNLGGEPPALVYTKEGYCVWCRGVVRKMADALGEQRGPPEPTGVLRPKLADCERALAAADDRITELTEQLRKSEAEVYRLMVVNQDLREWISASSSAMSRTPRATKR